MYKFISKELNYPKAAKKQGLTGISYISFIVKKDGSITDVKTARGFDPECDAEAERVVKAMPDWIPGRQKGNGGKKGEPIDVRFVLPIKFGQPKK